MPDPRYPHHRLDPWDYNLEPLPDYLPHLITHAILCFARCLDDPAFSVDMKVWHLPAEDGTLAVDFAGAVIAQHIYPGHHDEHCTPADFPEHCRHLEALYALTRGCAAEAVERIGTPARHSFGDDYQVDRYRPDDPLRFIASMQTLSRRLHRVHENFLSTHKLPSDRNQKT